MRETKTSRKVDLSKLPKCKLGVDWKQCKGLFIPFEYSNICGEIEILDYNSKTKMLTVKYKDNIKQMQRSHIRECAIGNLLGLITYDYKYNIDELVQVVNINKLKILKQIRIRTSGGNQKGYLYECTSCGYQDKILESVLDGKTGCNYCAGKKAIKYTNNQLYKMLHNKEDGIKYSQGSRVKVDWVCTECNLIIRNKSINMISHGRLSCPLCSPHTPYGEKFMVSILEQLSLYYEIQSTFDWSGQYRYDFYLNDCNCIVEINGLYHYEDTLGYIQRNSLKEQKIIDNKKRTIALKNGVKTYIKIDARESNIEYLKNSILHSDLINILNLQNINFEKCNLDASKCLIYNVCDIWNSGVHTLKEISESIGISHQRVKEMLVSGTKSNICDFDASVIYNNRIEKVRESRNIKVICLNTGEIFKSQVEAAKKYNLKTTSHLSQCCNGKRKTCGVNPITKERLRWAFYDKEDDIIE